MKVLSCIICFILLLCMLTGCKNCCKRHKYDCTIITTPTCEDNGLSLYTCRFCDDYYYQIEDAYYHSIDKALTCFRCGDLVSDDVNFTLTNSKNSYAIYDNYLSIKTKLIIPEYHDNLPVSEVAEYGFANTTYKKAVIAPSVTKINSHAFENAISLLSVKFYSLITIDDCAFNGCISLREIHIYNNIDYIGNNAFNNCISLETIHFYGNINDYTTCNVGSGNDNFLNAKVVFHPIPN